MRVSCKVKQAGPGTGSADSCHQSPETARGLQEGKGGGGVAKNKSFKQHWKAFKCCLNVVKKLLKCCLNVVHITSSDLNATKNSGSVLFLFL